MSDENILVALQHATEEIERLQKGWESLEWESKQEIERLQATVEHLQDQCKEKHDSMIAMMNEALGLRAALERIESNIGFSKTFLQKIAREALRDD